MDAAGNVMPNWETPGELAYLNNYLWKRNFFSSGVQYNINIILKSNLRVQNSINGGVIHEVICKNPTAVYWNI